MEYFNQQNLKEIILDFTIQGVEKFLKDNPILKFYVFAYDCNAEFGEINLCFNTETDFKNTLNEYQSGEFSNYYQTEDQIENLKFNTGDFKYQCFETINVLLKKNLQKFTIIFHKMIMNHGMVF